MAIQDYTHHARICGTEGVYAGAPGSEVRISTAGGTLYQRGTKLNLSATAMNKLVQGYALGYKLARGTVMGTASVAINTGLTTITGYVITSEGATATKANACVLTTASPSGATLTAYRWKHTSATNSTLAAASTAGTLGWMAIGT